MKKYSVLFITLCMVLCLIPSVGMLFFPTTQTTENKAMAPAPQLISQDVSLNMAFFQDFESWFNERIALRNQMVYADAMVQTRLFGESNVSGVVNGTDGWLYYTSTLEDYHGDNVMSQRELYNLAHNFRLIQSFAQARDMDFVLTIAPNKNTLYPDNMPYYQSAIVNPDHSAKLLAPYLTDVAYLDLFQMFESREELLYLLRDSHWNNKGACLAYNGIMDMLELPHENYEDREPVAVENENGDLNKMLYSFYGQLEVNYDYGLTQNYTYEKEDATVEDGWIVTNNPGKTGTLLMFRDSFGNTLIPFLSNEFGTACYSKGMPNALERYAEIYSPDAIVIQKVERNIREYLDNPPILSAPPAALSEKITVADSDSSVTAEVCLNDVNYYKFSGTLDPQRLGEDTEILVAVNGNVYEAYQTGENGFLLYLKKANLSGDAFRVQVYAVSGDSCTQLLNANLEIPQ